MIRLHFACGHEQDLLSQTQRPTCIQCGETRISRTIAPPPRFTGLCTGPTATFNPAIPAYAAPLKGGDS